MVTRDSSKHPAATATAAAEEEEEEFKRSGSSTAPAAGDAGGGGTESSYSIMNNTFRVDSRYSALKAIGKGSFGFVCSASDEKQGKRVAIKKIHPMAQHVVDAKHVLREIRLMRYLGSHPNIVSLEDLFVCEHYDELYIVMELLDSDLHRIIQSPQALGDAHHRYFMFQLLKGVKFLHDNRIIHRDLKPGNVLVTKNCQLRITDFGLARLRPMGRGAHPDDEVDNPMTEHVITRWYRPPELMLCPDGLYGYAVDLWSVGCIFAELLGRHPLFPGKNFMDQLTLIFDVVGSPQPHEVAHIRNSQAKKFLESMQDRVKVPYVDLFSSASEQAVDLLEGLLVFDPPGRLSVDVALDHPYFQPLRRSDVKPDPEVAPGFEFDFESEPLCRVQLKQMILEEVESFQRAQRKRDRRARAAAAVSSGSSSSSVAAAGASSSSSGSGSGGKVGPAVSKSLPAGDAAVDQDGIVTEEQQQQQQQLHQQQQQQHQHQQQQHQQQQWLRRQRRQAAGGAEAGTVRCSGMRGSGMSGEEDGGGMEKERAPISAVRSAQVVSEAATVRAGLGSMRNSVQSHWGPAGTAHPQEEYQSPPPQDRHAVSGGVKGASAADPMDDDGDASTMAAASSNTRWWNEEKTKTNGHPHHHSRHRHTHPQQQQQQQQPQPSYSSHDRSRQQQQQQRQQQQQARDAGTKWPTSGLAVPLDSPVRIRRSTHASALPGDGLSGARRVSSRKDGRDKGDGARGGGGGQKRAGSGGGDVRQYHPQSEHYHSHHHQHRQQQQQVPQQDQHVWGAKPAALRDVEDRFHRMNFDRTKHGRRTHDDMSDRSAGMRAPQR